jgi:hypothetical protein
VPPVAQQVRADRKADMSSVMFDAELSAYLSKRPGGASWHGNAPLREYLKREQAERQRAHAAEVKRRESRSASRQRGA